MKTRRCEFCLTIIVCSLFIQQTFAELPGDSPRMTPTVRLIQQLEPAVVAIFSRDDQGQASGSGSVIHPQGFVLTCDHVVQDRQGVVILNGQEIRPYRLIARLPEKDLAIIQYPVKDNHEATPIPLGRSYDLMTGEPILVAGNPGGRGIIFTTGIVSSRSSVLSLPNVLMQLQIGAEYRPRFIQFDAASNAGNSGGPLFNALGEQIGVVSAKNYNEENINYAIPIDTLREHQNAMLASEIRSDIFTGVVCDVMKRKPFISDVLSGSPAKKAGLQQGDRLVAVNQFPITDSLHWPLALLFHRAGQELKIHYQRDGQSKMTSLVLEPYPVREPVAVLKEMLQPGLMVTQYNGNYKKIPEIATLKKAREFPIQNWESPEEIAEKTDGFLLIYSGYLNVKESNAYQFVLGSDDGSRLKIDGNIVVDNDGHHPYQEESNWIRLEQGWHRVELEYLEWLGDSSLKLQWCQQGEELELFPFKLFSYQSSDDKQQSATPESAE